MVVVPCFSILVDVKSLKVQKSLRRKHYRTKLCDAMIFPPFLLRRVTGAFLAWWAVT